MMQNKAVVA